MYFECRYLDRDAAIIKSRKDEKKIVLQANDGCLKIITTITTVKTKAKK